MISVNQRHRKWFTWKRKPYCLCAEEERGRRNLICLPRDLKRLGHWDSPDMAGEDLEECWGGGIGEKASTANWILRKQIQEADEYTHFKGKMIFSLNSAFQLIIPPGQQNKDIFRHERLQRIFLLCTLSQKATVGCVPL